MQGAFILLGNNAFGYPLLIVMALSVYMYVCWRFWEGVTGQGSDDAFGPFKNFFKYRLSPVVSVSCNSTSCVFYDTFQHALSCQASSDYGLPSCIASSCCRLYSLQAGLYTNICLGDVEIQSTCMSKLLLRDVTAPGWHHHLYMVCLCLPPMHFGQA